MNFKVCESEPVSLLVLRFETCNLVYNVVKQNERMFRCSDPLSKRVRKLCGIFINRLL